MLGLGFRVWGLGLGGSGVLGSGFSGAQLRCRSAAWLRPSKPSAAAAVRTG